MAPETIGRGFKKLNVISRHAIAGASEPMIQPARGIKEMPNSRRLSRAEGRRGRHERNCVSSGFVSFITCSFQS